MWPAGTTTTEGIEVVARPRYPALALGATLVLVLPCAVPVASGAPWEMASRVSVSEVYTDNVERSASDEREELITILNPSVTLTRRTARSTAALGYAFEAQLYAKENKRNEVFHRLNADLDQQLTDNGFVDLGLRFGQQVVDPENTSVGIGVVDGGSVSDTTTVRISPYWQRRFGRDYSASARVTQRYVEYSRRTLDDTRETQVSASLDGGLRQRASWGISASRTEVKPDRANDSVLQESQVNGALRVTPKLQATALAGYEKNEIDGVAENSATGNFWEVGLIWTPRARDTIEVARGQRFFGQTLRASWRHSGKLDLSVTRSTALTTFAQLATDPTLAPNTQLRSRADVLVQNRLETRIGRSAGKSGVDLLLFVEESDNQLTGEQDDREGYGITWDYRITGRSTLTTSFDRTRFRFRDAAREETLRTFDLRFTRSLGRRARFSVNYQQVDSRDSDAVNEYVENEIRGTLDVDF